MSPSPCRNHAEPVLRTQKMQPIRYNMIILTLPEKWPQKEMSTEGTALAKFEMKFFKRGHIKWLASVSPPTVVSPNRALKNTARDAKKFLHTYDGMMGGVRISLQSVTQPQEKHSIPCVIPRTPDANPC